MIYVVAGGALGLVLPMARIGPRVDAESVGPLLYAFAGGLISFIALVFSLLFLVVQFGNTTVSPRITIFRDDPLVWHSFGFFAAVFVYCTAAGISTGARDEREGVSAAVAVLAIVLVLVSLALSRSVQMRALKLLQFNATIEEVRRRGEEVLVRFYPAPHASGPPAPTSMLPIVADVRWPRSTTILQQVDLPRLLREAERLDAVIELPVLIGDELRRGVTAAVIRASHPIDDHRIFDAFSVGVDRTFAQDPLLAFRLLSDIGDRALSAAVNDPATCVQTLGCIHDLLAIVVDKQLDFGPIHGADHRPRVQLRFPGWEDFMVAACDEIAHYAANAPTVRSRMITLLDDLASSAPAERLPALRTRRAALVERHQRNPYGVGRPAASI